MRKKHTKIVATLGPSSSDTETIQELIRHGASVFRLNFSHGSAEQHSKTAATIREAASTLNQHVAILGDLQGPKIRISNFKDGPVDLVVGDSFVLDSELAADAGDQQQVGITYKLEQDCQPGQTLLLDDGRVVLEIEEISGSRVKTKVIVGGKLSARKGINLMGGGLSAEALTEEDINNIKLAAELDLDYLAISFPRAASDMDYARKICADNNYHPRLVSKIERSEAVASDEILKALIDASDAVMVARGDLGVEVGDAELIGIQKKIISYARELNKVVITATQMMESMIENTIPTRAEVFDVANAVLDGTDAVMLSAETATGKHPARVVEAMKRIIIGAEQQSTARLSNHRLHNEFGQTDESIAMSAMYVANHLKGTSSIICFTETGDTPLWMSRIRSDIPIYALSRNEKTLKRVALFGGVIPWRFELKGNEGSEVLKNAIANLLNNELLGKGEKVIGTFGDQLGQCGNTNTMMIKVV